MSSRNAENQRQEGDDYGLQRTFISSIRLNAQHYLWKDAVGTNIHPAIPNPPGPNVRIADVGTGTGVWVTDVQREYPDATVDGFDISLDQAPAQELMPKGASVRVLDATQPLPSEFVWS